MVFNKEELYFTEKKHSNIYSHFVKNIIKAIVEKAKWFNTSDLLEAKKQAILTGRKFNFIIDNISRIKLKK